MSNLGRSDTDGGSNDDGVRKRRRRDRWGARVVVPDRNRVQPHRQGVVAHVVSAAPQVVEQFPSIGDNDAAAALIASAELAAAEKGKDKNIGKIKGRNNQSRGHSERQRRNNESNMGKRSWGDHDSGGGGGRFGGNDVSDTSTNAPSEPISGGGTKAGESTKPNEKELANFGLSGALATDETRGTMYKGVQLKFVEPPEARVPATRWRFYVFKKRRAGNGGEEAGGENDLIETLHVSKQSAYLFGRDETVADIPVLHPTLSKQHCVLQYRALPEPTTPNKQKKVRCRPYIMDLKSTNGTFLNGVRIDDSRYYELKRGDVLTLGQSLREYVLLTENSTSVAVSGGFEGGNK